MPDEDSRGEQVENDVQDAGGDTDDPYTTSPSDATDDLSELPDHVAEDVRHAAGRAGGDSNDPDITPTSNQDATDDLSELPDHVAEDIRHWEGRAGEGTGPSTA